MLRPLKSYLLMLSVLLISQIGQSQESQIFDNLFVKSTILKKEVGFGVYLPSNYDASNQSYPVLYLLHGGGGNKDTRRHQRLIQEFNLKETLDQAISENAITPMIVIIPDAGMSYYMNNINGEYQFEDYFMTELIPHIEKSYRCKTGKNHTAIAGFSMGGFGAFLYALHHPNKFSAVAAIGPAIRTDNQIREMAHDQYLRRYGSAIGNVKKEDERITDFWHSNSILYLVEHLSQEQLTQTKIQFVIGDEDYLYRGNSELHVLMSDKNIPHEYRVVDGKHVEYFSSEIMRAMKFINKHIYK